MIGSHFYHRTILPRTFLPCQKVKKTFLPSNIFTVKHFYHRTFLKNNFSQPHGQAHLVFPNAQTNAKKPKELFPTHPRQNSGYLHYWTMKF
jgi:hypothetical protein